MRGRRNGPAIGTLSGHASEVYRKIILAQLNFHRKGAKSAEGSGSSLAVKRNGKRKGAEN